MALKQYVKRHLLLSEEASLDVDLRYMPVVRFLKSKVPEAPILEVGSSYLGIAPYIDRVVIGSDTSFPGKAPDNLVPVVARGLLPFHDASFEAVISLDTLEHIPREFRQLFMNELFRVARTYVLVGFPEGERAAKHDAKMEGYFTRQHGEAHHFFVEHREYGLPRKEEAEAYFAEAGRVSGQTFRVQRKKNVNIGLRTFFMRLVWHRQHFIQRLYFVLTILGRWDRLFHVGECYRSLYFVTLEK